MADEETKEADDQEEGPITMGQVLFGVVFAALTGALCYYTWTNPDLLDSLLEADTSGRGARKVKWILNLVYNRVIGSLGGVLGLLVLWGTINGLLTRLKSGN